jgi:hypothetical protein
VNITDPSNPIDQAKTKCEQRKRSGREYRTKQRLEAKELGLVQLNYWVTEAEAKCEKEKYRGRGSLAEAIRHARLALVDPEPKSIPEAAPAPVVKKSARKVRISPAESAQLLLKMDSRLPKP